MKYPAYPNYKNDKQAGTGLLPEHWHSYRLKFLVELRNEKVDAELSDLPYMGLEHIESWTCRKLDDEEASAEGIASRYVSGNVLFGKLRPYLAKVYLADNEGLASTEALVMAVGQRLLPRFLKYVLVSSRFVDLVSGASYGSKMPRASWEHIGSVAVAVPTIEEQEQVSDFLDWRTAQIDALIAKKQALLERLTEKRVNVIASSVTNGLVRQVEVRPSGAPWFAQVPKHWQVKRIKFIGTIGNGSTPARDDSSYWNEGSFPWLNSSVANQEAVTEAEQFVTQLALKECHLPIIEPPAVLVGITGQGKTRGMATTLMIRATINQHLAYIKPDETGCDARFLRRVFDAAYAYLRNESDGGGSTKGAITCEQIAELPIPVPPLEEQQAIADHIDKVLDRINRIADKATNAIERLTEYRSALITAAVTGQIDVRAVPVPV